VANASVPVSGRRSDAAAAAAEHSDVPIDEYLLQIWPAPPSPAVTLKHTSQQYAYWQNRR